MILGWLLAISLIINGLMFLLAYRLKSDKLTDASYAITFIALGVVGFLQSEKSFYAWIGLSLVLTWGLRIGGFLLYRVVKAGRDQRFDGIREDFVKFGKFWLGQAIVAWVLMIPISLAFNASGEWNGIALAGLSVWLIGFATETVADTQKYLFTTRPSNRGMWIDSGVWRYSRHPNYFGEILVWIGIYIYAAAQLSGLELVVGLISPICIAGLLIFVSGIPILEKSADKRWGKIREYQEYKSRTSVLIPLPRTK